jgi:hypothetical protein
MKAGIVRRLLIAGGAFTAIVLGLAGCPLPGTGVTVSGWFVGYYFEISSDVKVTLSQGDTSVTVDAPVATYASGQSGAFLVAGVPTGTYSVTVTFQNPWGYTSGTTYSLDGGDTWWPVDGETVTGGADPYTFTITIDSLTIDSNTKIDLDFGDVG